MEAIVVDKTEVVNQMNLETSYLSVVNKFSFN